MDGAPSPLPPPPDLAAWAGRRDVAHDVIGATPVKALAATLDLDGIDASDGAPLPPLWHWLYGLPLHRQSELGPDGHARRGGFLPPVPLPRRMWAGGRLQFRAPLRVGDRIERASVIESVSRKDGRSGPLVFVTVRHEIRRDGESAPALVEQHDIVYRDARRPGEPEPPPQAAPAPAAWRREILPDEVLLFRYSALTFNGHRIHYDRRYCTAVEGYPGLVVHGPLIATLLLDLLRRERPDADVASFRFRAVRPLFDGRPFHVNGVPDRDGRRVALWASAPDGALAMEADASLR